MKTWNSTLKPLTQLKLIKSHDNYFLLLWNNVYEFLGTNYCIPKRCPSAKFCPPLAQTSLYATGRNEVGQGGRNFPGAEPLRRAPKWLRMASRSSNNVASAFFKKPHLLPKDLSFAMGAPNFLPRAPSNFVTPLTDWSLGKIRQLSEATLGCSQSPTNV